MENTKRYKKGKSMRAAVLGEKHVKNAIEAAGEFGDYFQQWSTEVAWGELWTRPGIDRKTRSLCTIGILAANGQEPELLIHCKGALNNGATKEEIMEVFLQVAVYSGFPAGHTAFRVARNLFD